MWVGKSETCVLEISLSCFTCGLREIKGGFGGGGGGMFLWVAAKTTQV